MGANTSQLNKGLNKSQQMVRSAMGRVSGMVGGIMTAVGGIGIAGAIAGAASVAVRFEQIMIDVRGNFRLLGDHENPPILHLSRTATTLLPGTGYGRPVSARLEKTGEPAANRTWIVEETMNQNKSPW